MRSIVFPVVMVVLLVAGVASQAAEYWWFGDTDPQTAGWAIDPTASDGTLTGSVVADPAATKGSAWEIVKGPGQYLKYVLSSLPGTPPTPIAIDPLKGATLVWRMAVQQNGTDAPAPAFPAWHRRNAQLTSTVVPTGAPGMGGRDSVGYWLSGDAYDIEMAGMFCATAPEGQSYPVPSTWQVENKWTYNTYWLTFYYAEGSYHWDWWVKPNWTYMFWGPNDGRIVAYGDTARCEADLPGLLDSIAFGAWDTFVEDNNPTTGPSGYEQTLRWDYVYFTDDGHFWPDTKKGVPLLIEAGPTVFADRTSGTNARVDFLMGEPTTASAFYRVAETAGSYTEVPDPYNPEARTVHQILMDQSATNPVQNADFEVWPVNLQVATNWTKWTAPGSNTITFFQSTSPKHSGTYAQSFGRTDNLKQDGAITQAVATVAGKWYAVSGWVYYIASDASVTVQMGADPSGQIANGAASTVAYGTVAAGLADKGKWLYHTKIVQATGASLSAWVRFSQQGQTTAGQHKCYVDDMSVREVTLTPDTIYDYYVRNQAGTVIVNTPPAKFATWIYPDWDIKNKSFEGLADPWEAVGTQSAADWIMLSGAWELPAHQGGYLAASVSSSNTEKDMDVLYEQFKTNPGQLYLATSYVFTDQTGGTPDAVACRIGIDPTGGIDPGQWSSPTPPRQWIENPNIIWSGWTSTDGSWQQVLVGAWAQSSLATVFLQVHTQFALESNKCAFDSVALATGYESPTNIAGTKELGDGYPIEFSADHRKIVTACWNIGEEHRFYIEEADRSSGIRVVCGAGLTAPAVGTLVSLKGAMSSTGPERQINAISITDGGPADVPAPLALTNRDLVGGQFGKQAGVTDRGAGTNNVGLLCKIWGRVVDVGGQVEWTGQSTNAGAPDYDPYGRSHFYVDDGTGVTADYIYGCLQYDGEQCILWGGTEHFRGVKVYFHPGDLSGNLMPGDWLVCTGLAQIERTENQFPIGGTEAQLIRAFEVRDTTFERWGEPGEPDFWTDVLLFTN